MIFKLTKNIKIGLAIAVLVLVVISYFAAKAAYHEYQFIKERADRVEFLETRVDTLESREQKELDNVSKTIKRSRSNKNNITKKQKEDEKNIDDTSVSDDDIDKLLARFKDD